MIRYLKHHEIDLGRWDLTIENATNRMLYAQSWYLNIVTSGWEALVCDDYASVMPLPVKHKFIIPYLIQPRYTQQLGIFSREEIPQSIVLAFLKAIPRKFVWYDINLNYANNYQDIQNTTYQDNFELELSHAYDFLWKNFNENTRRNIRRTGTSGFYIEISESPAVFVNNYLANCKIRPDKRGEIQFNSLIEEAMRLKCGYALIVKAADKSIIAGAFFLSQFNRLVYLASFTTEAGRAGSAMFFLVNHIIKANLGKGLILDFEGSTIPGVAGFFAGFGAKSIKYPRLKYRLF